MTGVTPAIKSPSATETDPFASLARPKTPDSSPPRNSQRKREEDVESTRVTIKLPIVLDENIELYALLHNESKMGVIRKALSYFLTNNGLNPAIPLSEKIQG